MEPTDHKGVEEALRVSEELFRTLLQFSFDVFARQHQPPAIPWITWF
jgi:hypothetical protein